MRWAILLALALLTACASDPQLPTGDEATPAAPSEPPTSIYVQRPTLPPTWTPTPTPTITATPTITPTPTDTRTPPPTPTFTVDEICETTSMTFMVAPGVDYRPSDRVSFFAQSAAPQIEIVLRTVNQATGEAEDLVFDGGVWHIGVINMDFAPGAYDWTLSARTPGERDLCPHSGTFTVVEPRQKARLRIGWLTDPPKPIILIQFP